MFGYVTPVDTYQAVLNGAESYASLARQWHQDADRVAGRSPRVAARMRDVARALNDLAHLANDINRDLARK